jgi:hypothetical protein
LNLVCIVTCTGEFQGPALVAILEGVSLSREEVCSLQLLPPWKLRGDTLNYGLGLLSCYFVCDLLSIVSGGNFYMFDPRGLVLALPSASAPAAKMFPLIGILLNIICLLVIHYFFAFYTAFFIVDPTML